MLVLSRKKQESIVIDGHTTITILDCGRGGIRIGITAPADVSIVRQELLADGLQANLNSILNARRTPHTDRTWLPVE